MYKCNYCKQEKPYENFGFKPNGVQKKVCIVCCEFLRAQSTQNCKNKKRQRIEIVDTAEYIIKNKGNPTEFEIQAFVFNELLKLGLKVRGELFSTNRKHRFDIVVFDDMDKPTLIIEIKKHRKAPSKKFGGKYRRALNKQVREYKKYNVKLKLIQGMKAAKNFIEQQKSFVFFEKNKSNFSKQG